MLALSPGTAAMTGSAWGERRPPGLRPGQRCQPLRPERRRSGQGLLAPSQLQTQPRSPARRDQTPDAEHARGRRCSVRLRSLAGRLASTPCSEASMAGFDDQPVSGLNEIGTAGLLSRNDWRPDAHGCGRVSAVLFRAVTVAATLELPCGHAGGRCGSRHPRSGRGSGRAIR